LDGFLEYLGEHVQDAFLDSPRKIRVSVRKEAIQDVAKKISRLTAHISTITGVDCEDGVVELHYHFVVPKNNLKSLKLNQEDHSLLSSGFESALVTIITTLPPENLAIDSIARIYPGAQFYEREIREMFGLEIRGIFSSEYLLLADDFPPDVHPLRKSTSLDAMIDEHKNARMRHLSDQAEKKGKKPD
jgi:Ni,Fe-hydrogenase III component G